MADIRNICEERIILILDCADLTPDIGIVSRSVIGIRVALEISPSHMEHCCARHPPYVRRNEIMDPRQQRDCATGTWALASDSVRRVKMATQRQCEHRIMEATVHGSSLGCMSSNGENIAPAEVGARG